jgi:hypothetical protein
MELNKLDKLIREVKLMLSKDDTPEMVRLLYDLEEAPYSYKKQYETLDGIQLAAFDHALWQRIAAFPKLVEKGDKAAAAMREFKMNWSAREKVEKLTIYFGQIQVAPTFQESQTVEKADIKGLPEIVGKAINEVQGSIHGGQILCDQIPIQIFWLNDKQKWVTCNNRGYTAHCKAKVRPMRIIPVRPKPDDLNRLRDTATVPGEVKLADGTISPLKYASETLPRAEERKRTLPSLEMLITSSGEILDVVKVPKEWN